MSRAFLKDAFGWGFILWLIGYGLGILLFTIVPAKAIGWIILPIGTLLTLWVAFRKLKGDSFRYYFLVAVVWVLIAVLFDYFFLVKAFKPEDGYYKLDVYIYYALTFLIPFFAGFRRKIPRSQPSS